MSIFDESVSEVEASHQRLASVVSDEVEVLVACADLIRKTLLYQDIARHDAEEHADYLAVSQLGFRLVNDMGAATKLLDCGYFVQAAAVIRDIAEIGMLALYFAQEPEKARAWRLALNERYKKFGRRALSGKVNDGRKFAFLDRHFNTFSEYGTHPSSTAIIAHFDGTRLHIGPHFNEALYRYTIRDLAILSWHVTDACGDAYLKLFHVSVADLYPAETHRFVRSQSSIAPMQPEL